MSKPVFLILSLLTLFSFNTFAKDGYTITIKIAGLPKQKLLLGYYYGDKQYIRDSAVTDATGKAIFKGKETLEGGIYMIANNQRNLLFDLVVTEQEFTLETDTFDMIGNMVVKGSPENDGFFAYSKFTNKAGKEAIKVDERLKREKDD